MTRTETIDALPSPSMSIEALVAQHGAWRVFRAATVALIRAWVRPHAPRIEHLPAHLRRDIGLPPLRGERSDPWRYR